MAGQLESAIVEIRLMYDSFRSLMAISPNLPPDCVVECLKKFFRNCNRPLFTAGSSGAQIKIMTNLKTAFEAYQTLAKMSPKSAPAALIKTLGTILTVSNPVKVETNGDESDCSVEIIDVETLQNGNNDNNKEDNNDVECQENAAATNSDGDLYTDEQVEEAVPSTSFSSLHTQLQQRVNSWVNGEPILSPISTPTSSSEQDETNILEVASQNTTDAENTKGNADEVASNADSSSSSDFSFQMNQNEQQNDSEIPVPPESKKGYECSYGCEKTFRSEYWRLAHEKTHSGIGLVKCNFCDREFTTSSNCMRHQVARHRQGRRLPTVQKGGQKRRILSDSTKSFKCDFCSRKFANVQGLEEHRARNTEERLKKCRFPPCTRKFCYQSNLANHEKRHTRL